MLRLRGGEPAVPIALRRALRPGGIAAEQPRCPHRRAVPAHAEQPRRNGAHGIGKPLRQPQRVQHPRADEKRKERREHRARAERQPLRHRLRRALRAQQQKRRPPGKQQRLQYPAQPSLHLYHLGTNVCRGGKI